MTLQPRVPSLYMQVLFGIAAGALLGYLAPESGAAMRPLGDGFIKLVRMLIAPIIFTTVVVGIAQMGAMKEVGRIGLRALLYFEVVSTIALVIGLVVVNDLSRGRHERRPRDRSTSAPSRLHDRVAGPEHDRVPPQHHSRTR